MTAQATISPPADGTEAVCAGCGRTVTFSCPPYVPVRFGEWVDADVVDVDINGHGESGRTCPDGNDHRPTVATAVA